MKRVPLHLLTGLIGAMLLPLSLAHAQDNNQDSNQDGLDRIVEFSIQPQGLDTAMVEFANQSGIQVVTPGEELANMRSPGVTGSHPAAAALERLLFGTGVEYEAVGDATIALTGPALNGSAAGQNTTGQRRPGIEEIIVTGQKREERIQDVPIAISAFSPEDLEAQKIEGGFDLLKGVPNVTFSKTNFSGYNFQIRGIGTQAVSATTDPGVAVSFNNTTLIVNRLFEQEYLDVERVEVLRGPQGTLFGRNATAGVINVISNKPELGVWDGMIDVEAGNYNTRRLRGFFNAPIGDTLAIRGAYASTQRDGFGYNEASEKPGVDVQPDVDNRDLWTGRFTLGWQPNDRLRVNLLWERFEEDDRRVRTSKQLCHHDPSQNSVGGVEFQPEAGPYAPASLSQGCVPGSLYSDEAYGTPNGASLPYVSGLGFSQLLAGIIEFAEPSAFDGAGWVVGPNPYFPDHQFADFGLVLGLEDPADAPCSLMAEQRAIFSFDICNPDPYAEPGTGEILTQSRDLRTIYSELEPEYRASADIIELSFDYEVTDELLFSSQTVYVDDEYYATQDYNRFRSFPFFNADVDEACSLSPDPFGFGFEVVDCTEAARGTFAGGFYVDLLRHPETGEDGVFCDPQLGCSNQLRVQDLSRASSTQYNQELRLVSSYAGDWNFSLGANFTKFRTFNDYFVFSNSFTHLLHFAPFNPPPEVSNLCPAGSDEGQFCRYVDPNPLGEIDGEGHNYFRSANPYKLTSSALFGELYWNATDTVKLTLGLRMTWDQKVFTPIPSQLLLADYRELGSVDAGEPPPSVRSCKRQAPFCPLTGNAVGGRGSPANPDIIQSWREPTGRFVVDWQPVLGFTDETMVYASFSHGYKGGGANPPTVAPPSGLILAEASGGTAPATFEPEFVNAYELGTKNTLFGGAVVLNGTAFYYDYTDYQVSKIVDRSAANENFDAKIWGLELETIFAPSLDWQFNAAIGYLNTEIANGEQSLDLMDRAQGGNQPFTGGNGITYDSWEVIKPWVTASSNCIAPTEVLAANLFNNVLGESRSLEARFCPAGGILGGSEGPIDYFDENGDFIPAGDPAHDGRRYDPLVDAPNNAAGFLADLSGNELPNAPHLTVALGAQYNFDLTRDWQATARVDYYWQDESYARVYNTEFDRLKSWSNTNLSFWITNPNNGITVEGYVKNVFDETPITGTFLNSDDSGLTTNVFTLDPRLIGVSLRKEF